MKRSLKLASGAAAALGIGFAAMAIGQPSSMGHSGMAGHAMHGGMAGQMGGSGHGPMGTAMLTTQDAGSAADMDVVHDLLSNNTKIRRSVTKLPDGIRTVTESDEPEIAKSIQAHVASMSQRLGEGREFNIFSNTLPVLFENRDKIASKVEMTGKGVAVTQTSADASVVAALQAHAEEVTTLVQDGMLAMRRGMMTRMAMAGGMQGMRMGQSHQKR